MVFEGKVDFSFGLSTHSYYINKYGLVGVKPVHVLLERPSKVGMAVRTDWPELVAILNKAISSFSDQEIDTIVGRWIDLPVQKKELDLTPEERAWLDLKHTVGVRVVDWPPYMIAKDNEPPQGIVIEYLKLIGERSGITFKYEVTDQPFAEFIESMKQHKGPDMTPVIIPTPERQQYLSFSKTYISSPYVIFIRDQDEPILDVNGLAEKTVAVPRGFVLHDKLAREDIPMIVQFYVDIFTRKLGKKIKSIPAKVMKTLQSYNWPGNVRELQNVIERMVIATTDAKLQLPDEFSQADQAASPSESFKSLRDMERDYIVSVLEKTGWKVSGKDSAAEILGLDRSTLRARMKKLGIHKK